jgi:deazaflavin-dependent oxidoreductase (nitroreductase family)
VTGHGRGWLLRPVLHAPTWLYRLHLGWLLGHRFLMLTHIGRRTGRTYRTVLEIVGGPQETREYVVMSGFGPKADWLLNLRSGGGVDVTVGRDHFRPAMRVLAEDEAVAVLARYERRNQLVAPLVRRVLSSLLGWRYSGHDEERRRLVSELPLVALGRATVG